MSDYDSIKKELEYLKKKNEALMQAVNTLEGELKAIKMVNEMLVNEKRQWFTQKEIQEKVIQEALNRSNEQNQRYQETIQGLREKIKNSENNNAIMNGND